MNNKNDLQLEKNFSAQMQKMQKDHIELQKKYKELVELYYEEKEDNFVLIGDLDEKDKISKNFKNKNDELYALKVHNEQLIKKLKTFENQHQQELQISKNEITKLKKLIFKYENQQGKDQIKISNLENENKDLQYKLKNFFGLKQEEEISAQLKYIQIEERNKYQAMIEQLMNQLNVETAHSNSAWINYKKLQVKTNDIIQSKEKIYEEKINLLDYNYQQIIKSKQEIEEELEKIKHTKLKTYEYLNEAFELNKKYKYDMKWMELYSLSEQKNNFYCQKIEILSKQIEEIKNFIPQLSEAFQEKIAEKQVQKDFDLLSLDGIDGLEVIKSQTFLKNNNLNNSNDNNEIEPIFQVRDFNQVNNNQTFNSNILNEDVLINNRNNIKQSNNSSFSIFK